MVIGSVLLSDPHSTQTSHPVCEYNISWEKDRESNPRPTQTGGLLYH